MKNYLKSFLHRGFVFGGFGPIILGIVFLILENTLPDFSLGGGEVCLAIICTYIIAFVQAGSSVFHQIEEWSLPKAALCQFLSLYAAYLFAYLVNSWIEPDIWVILLFTLIFVLVYISIWLSVYFVVKALERKLNKKLH